MNSRIRIFSLLILNIIATTSVAQTQADSIVSRGRTLYIMDEALSLNGYAISDSFNYDQALNEIGIPDSVQFGGPSIIEEFGADDYWMYYGRSVVGAGHGYILLVEIFDQSLSISGVKIRDSRETVKAKLNKNFSDGKLIEFITQGDDILGFQFDAEDKVEKMYYSRPL